MCSEQRIKENFTSLNRVVIRCPQLSETEGILSTQNCCFSHGLYSPQGRKELDTTERLSLSFSFSETKFWTNPGKLVSLGRSYLAVERGWLLSTREVGFLVCFILAAFSSAQAFSGCGAWRLPQLQCRGFSCCGLLALGVRGFSSCGSQVLECGLNSCGMWTQEVLSTQELPLSGIKSVSSALSGRYFTTEPPGKPENCILRFKTITERKHELLMFSKRGARVKEKRGVISISHLTWCISFP